MRGKKAQKQPMIFENDPLESKEAFEEDLLEKEMADEKLQKFVEDPHLLK